MIRECQAMNKNVWCKTFTGNEDKKNHTRRDMYEASSPSF